MMSSLNLASLTIHVFIFTILTPGSLSTASTNSRNPHPPKISVTQSGSNSSQPSLHINMFNESLMVINSKNTTQNVILNCSASYPVMWSLTSLDNHWVVDDSTHTERKVGNFTDNSTYEYSMSVSINNQLPVNSTSQLPEQTFTCHRADFYAKSLRELLASSSRLVVVWERPGYTETKINFSAVWPYWNDLEHYALIDGEFQIYWDEEAEANQSLLGNWILIPCYTLNANETEVELFKRTNYEDGADDLGGEGEAVDENKGDETSFVAYLNVFLIFEPYVGFYVRPPSIHSDVEIFECHARRRQDGGGLEGVSVSTSLPVTPGSHNSAAATDTRIFRLVKLHNTTAAPQSIDLIPSTAERDGTRTAAEVGSLPPPVEVSPTLFQLNIQSPMLHLNLTSAGIQCCLTPGYREQWSSANFILSAHICTSPLMCLTTKYRTLALNSHGYRSFKSDSNCRYSNHRVTENFYSSEDSPTLFVCHMETDKRLRKTNEASCDTVQVRCESTPFYHADGILWEKEWENGTTEFMREEQVNATRQDSISPLLSSKQVFLKIVSGLVAIRCYVPPWNTTTWIIYSYSFSTEAPTHPASPTGQTTFHENVTYFTGENKTLECDFEGSPTPKITWRILNSGSHCRSSRMQGCYGIEAQISGSEPRSYGWLFHNDYDTGSFLTDPNLVILHYTSNSSETPSAGQASCSATNLAGNATKYFYIEARSSERPILKESGRESIVLFVGDEGCFLTCSVIQGAPVPTFSWKKHGKGIEHFTDNYAVAESSGRSNVSTLTFKKVRYEDDGDYACVASNFLGNATHIFSVQVRDRPPSTGRTWAEIAVAVLSVSLGTMVGLFAYLIIVRAKRNSSQLQEEGVVEYSARGGGGGENLQGSQVTVGTNLGWTRRT